MTCTGNQILFEWSNQDK